MVHSKLFLKKLGVLTLVIYLLSNANQCLIAQYFSNSYDLDQTSNTGITIIPVDDGILISVGSICGLTTTLENCVGLLKTDFDGNVIWTRIIEGFKTPTMNSMIVDGAYIYMAVRHNIAPAANIKILKLDMAGNMVEEWDMGETQEYELPFGIIKYQEGFVIYSLLFPPGTTENIAWILFTDSLFNPLHEAFFDEADPEYGLVVSRDLKATTDGNLIATFNDGSLGAVTKLDSAGNILWQTRLPRNYDGINAQNIHVTELQDGAYAVNWFRYQNTNWELYEAPPAIFKLDTEGNILWERVFNTLHYDYEVKYMGNLFTAANGDIVGVGNRYFYNDDLERYTVCGWMFRLDPETGAVLWDRTLCDLSRSLQYFHGFTAGSELANGDLVFTGAYEDTFPNGLPFINDPNVWLVRLSAEGCLVEGCEEWTIINPDGSITATEESLPINGRFVVYPNPGNGQVWVVAESESLAGQHCSIALYDAQGRQMKAETLQPGRPQQFDWGDLLPGMYYYLIRTEEAAGTQSGKLVIVR